MRSILVTGHNGFIGHHVFSRLSKRGDCNVHGVGLPYYDLLEDESLDMAMKGKKPDMVVHLAAQSQLRRSIKDPAFDAENNIIASIKLLEWCVKRGVKNVIYTSTGGARYGEGAEGKRFKESDVPNPICPYGISKYTVEKYLQFYKNMYDINSVSLCLGNVYGPGDDLENNRLITTVIHSLRSGDKIYLAGNGNVIRDFVYIDDVVDLIENMAMRDICYPHDTYNISTESATVNEVVGCVLNVFGEKRENTRIKNKPFINGEVVSVTLDCELAKKELNWNPRVPLSEGLKRTAEYYENQCANTSKKR